MSDTMVAERQESRPELRREERQTPAPEAQDRAPRQQAPAMTPHVDVLEDQTGITLLADLPGVPREALEIHVRTPRAPFLAAVMRVPRQHLDTYHLFLARNVLSSVNTVSPR